MSTTIRSDLWILLEIKVITTEICSFVDLLCRMMKLGSNRKTMGIGVGIREFSVDNKRVCVANYDQQLTTVGRNYHNLLLNFPDS